MTPRRRAIPSRAAGDVQRLPRTAGRPEACIQPYAQRDSVAFVEKWTNSHSVPLRFQVIGT